MGKMIPGIDIREHKDLTNQKEKQTNGKMGEDQDKGIHKIRKAED